MSAKIPQCTIERTNGKFSMNVTPGVISWKSPQSLDATNIEEAIEQAKEILATNYNGGMNVGTMNEKISAEKAYFEAIIPAE